MISLYLVLKNKRCLIRESTKAKKVQRISLIMLSVYKMNVNKRENEKLHDQHNFLAFGTSLTIISIQGIILHGLHVAHACCGAQLNFVASPYNFGWLENRRKCDREVRVKKRAKCCRTYARKLRRAALLVCFSLLSRRPALSDEAVSTKEHFCTHHQSYSLILSSKNGITTRFLAHFSIINLWCIGEFHSWSNPWYHEPA